MEPVADPVDLGNESAGSKVLKREPSKKKSAGTELSKKNRKESRKKKPRAASEPVSRDNFLSATKKSKRYSSSIGRLAGVEEETSSPALSRKSWSGAISRSPLNVSDPASRETSIRGPGAMSSLGISSIPGNLGKRKKSGQSARLVDAAKSKSAARGKNSGSSFAFASDDSTGLIHESNLKDAQKSVKAKKVISTKSKPLAQ